MGRKKEYDIRSINFGKRGEPARILVEEFVKRNGSAQLSALIRNLVVAFLGKKKGYDSLRKEVLILQRQEIGRQIQELANQKRRINDELEKMGVDYDLAY